MVMLTSKDDHREKKKTFFPSRVGSREMKDKEGRQEE
jgi:hypothetical protein